MLMRERPRTSAAMPAPAPLPSLRDALQRRAAVFGPFDLDESQGAPRRLLARCASALRGVADLLEPTAPRGLREAGGARRLKRS